ncbi:MAG: hypothetical protein ACYS30_19620 [Planctomycetota bacterium]|jgi:hypothetical protein
MDKVKCHSCESTDGEFHTFVSHMQTFYYWVCECGANHGHAGTKAEAYDVWRQYNMESPVTSANTQRLAK